MTIDLNRTVGQLVAERSGRGRVFKRLGIDYCCGGRVPLEQACRARGLDPRSVVRALECCDDRSYEGETDDYVPATVGALVDFIVATHHAYLRRELPRLELGRTRCLVGYRSPRPSERRGSDRRRCETWAKS